MPPSSSRVAVVRHLVKQRWLAVAAAVMLTGLGAAITAVLFKNGVHAVVHWRLELARELTPMLGPSTQWLLFPSISALGGLLVGLLLKFGEPAASGSGITQVMHWLAGRPVPMGIRVAIIKLIGGIIAIGSGFPLGPEGPAVQMGASVAWRVAESLKAPRSFMRLIVAAGGGAGISAVFNAPIGGFLYSIEELLRNARPVVLLLVLFTTFLADSFGEVFNWIGFGKGSGIDPTTGITVSKAFDLPDFVFRPEDVIYLVILGLIISCLSELFTRYVIAMQGLSMRLLGRRPVLRMVLCGALLGLIFAALPLDFGDAAGLKSTLVLDIRDGSDHVGKYIAIFVVLFFTTGLAAASGAPGGLFAPMLMLGGAIGLAASGIVAGLTGYAPASYVFAGMASFVAGSSHTPIAALFITFALTKQLVLLRPMLVATLSCFLLSQAFSHKSIYDRQIELEKQGGAMWAVGRRLTSRSKEARD
ncbi:MAG: ClC family H(+)/Cl(-) exchange transporter [Aphanocapsa feldmannii 288cV]|nr:MAG: ClC family H(+)/Cl(-) exchange transporter [Aphanocapsa feldmannii 288cV]